MIILKKINTLKLAIIITKVFFVFLIGFCIGLPWLISWYAEVMHRSATLAATVMLTCYPCAPFAGALLIFLQKLLKNVMANEIFCEANLNIFKKMFICCVVISLITLIAGKFYMPFLLVGATFAFLSLLLLSLKGIIEVVKNKEQNP